MELTLDGIEPEINLHSDYMNWFNKNNIKYKAWGSSGPDFLLTELNLIGEVKKTDTVSLLKEAVKELYDRQKPLFKINHYKAFFVISGKIIRYYTQTSKEKWTDVNLDDCITFTDREIFLDYIKSKNNKVDVEAHLNFVLDFLLDDKFGMCITDGLNLLFNLNNPHYVFVKNAIYFNPDEENEICIEFNNDKQLKKELINFLNVFTLKNLQNIKDYIKHNYSQHLPDSKKANLGKYYTPKRIVELLKNEIESEITDNTYVMDLACGCGAFLELFNDCHIMGRDVDSQAIEILELFNFENIAVDNTLLNVSRNKYHLSENDDLVIIGNPPYNDSSSINKRYSTKSKAKRLPEDSDIHCRDIGRSFLEAYAKLKPRSICILHPLSYLIKKVNFKSLKRLSKNYKLTSATIFSSDEFEDLKGGSVFPIVIAHYNLCDEGMTYEYIKNFHFNILDSNKKFTLANVEQAGHDYIHQTVTSIDVNNNSDIDLYHYNFRDLNSLNKANFQSAEYREEHKDTMVVVNYVYLWKYCYVNCIKKFLLPLLPEGNNYILGNLNPIIDKRMVENSNYWKDLFTICAILKNSHRIDVMNIDNRNENMLTKRFLLNDYRKRSKEIKDDKINHYKMFLEFIDTKDERLRENIYQLVINYFRNLIAKCFI